MSLQPSISGCISLAGDCLAMEKTPLSFIRQAVFMYKPSITWGTQHYYWKMRCDSVSTTFFQPTACSHHPFLFIWSMFFLLGRNKRRCGFKKDVAAVLICQFYQSVAIPPQKAWESIFWAHLFLQNVQGSYGTGRWTQEKCNGPN